MSNPDQLTVRVIGVNPTGALAFVDGVRVRIRARDTMPPLWICDQHGRGEDPQQCTHTAALAATPRERTDP